MAFGGGLKLQRFSTSGLPQRERHAAFVNRDWPSIGPVYRTTPLEPFDVISDRLMLGGLVVHYVRISALQWTRDEAMLRSHDTDSLTMAITLEGEAKGIFGDRSESTGKGDAQFADLSLTSSHVSTASHTLHLSIPRQLVVQRGIDPRVLHGTKASGAAVRILTSHLLQLRECAGELPAGSGETLSRGILDLIGMVVMGTGRGVMQAPGENAAKIAACFIIDDELGMQRLGPESLCKALGISRSKLHRLFEAEGGVQAFIRHRRLEAVRSKLADPFFTEPLSLLAERYGFSDASHMSRLFRHAYGETPTAFRNRPR